MIVHAAARRYARALAAASEGAKESDAALRDLGAIAAAVEADPVVRLRLADPILGRRRKKVLIQAVVDAWKPNVFVGRLLVTMAENDRTGQISEILEAYRQELDRRRGIVEAEVVTAVPLDGPSREKLQAALGSLLGKRVRLVEKTDAGILGGVVARVGGTVYDASVLSRLEQIRGAMTQE